MHQAMQAYLDAFGALLVARREHGGPLHQEEESRAAALLERLREALSPEDRVTVDAMFPAEEVL
jgi:hypothetical protein